MSGAYDDEAMWPLKCANSRCSAEFETQIGWLKTHAEVKCPGVINPLGPIPCPDTIRIDRGDLDFHIAEAKAGRYDPYAIWVRKRRP